MTQTSAQSRHISPFAKAAFKVQIFLLRRNWMGSAGNIIMVITTIMTITAMTSPAVAGGIRGRATPQAMIIMITTIMTTTAMIHQAVG